jgi:hypothetical protein
LQERHYQGKLIRKLRHLFPGCVILKNDSSYLQGVPDLIILYGDRWAMLEVKASEDAGYQPNQQYYVDLLGAMSFASFIYPEIEEEVLHALQQAFQPRRSARVSQR